MTGVEGGTHVLEENLENTTGLLVDETRDTLDTTTAGKTTNSGLGNTWNAMSEPSKPPLGLHTLDVVTKNLAVTLSTALSKTFSTFSTSRHY